MVRSLRNSTHLKIVPTALACTERNAHFKPRHGPKLAEATCNAEAIECSRACIHTHTHTHGLGGPRRNAQEADLALGPFVLTEQEATVANPSPAYTDEDMIILSGVDKEHKSNVYGYIRAFDLQVWMVLLCFLMVAAGVAMLAEILVRHSCARKPLHSLLELYLAIRF